MFIKRSKVEIAAVIKDSDHNLDDEGTRKALAKTKEQIEKELVTKSKLEN
jgi:hypothetical protein